MLKITQRPHIIGVRSTSRRDEPLLYKKFHIEVPVRTHPDFTTYIRQGRNANWAHADQCKMIFTAIDNKGDYWCGNYRASTDPDRFKQQYCKSCRKIIYHTDTKKKK